MGERGVCYFHTVSMVRSATERARIQLSCHPNTTILPPSGLFYFGMLQPAGDMQISATSSISIATISDGYITVQWPLYSECHDNETLLTLTLAA